nr:S-layer homology domain-containing protein [Planococcus glaciei]
MKNLLTKASLFFVAMILVITSLGSHSASAAGVPFKDIKTTDKEIIYLWQKGLINGTSRTTFGPTESVTREQAATMIGRAINLNGTPRKTSFKDVDSKATLPATFSQLLTKESLPEIQMAISAQRIQ